MKEKDKKQKNKTEKQEKLKQEPYRGKPLHPVDEAADESFPASDPPSWTPTRAN